MCSFWCQRALKNILSTRCMKASQTLKTRSKTTSWVITNTPTSRKCSSQDGSYIRKSAIRYNIPYMTTLTAAQSRRWRYIFKKIMSPNKQVYLHALLLPAVAFQPSYEGSLQPGGDLGGLYIQAHNWSDEGPSKINPGYSWHKRKHRNCGRAHWSPKRIIDAVLVLGYHVA